MTELARQQANIDGGPSQTRTDLLEEREINDELESFIFDNCLTVQERLYPLVKFWPAVFKLGATYHAQTKPS